MGNHPAGVEQRIRLEDGRTLAYSEHGNPSGQPVLFFHGLPSSRLMHPDEVVTRSLGARLITIDRPGFGLG
jgi:pimeloyl-ACP methyl ester carboxylesterase